MCCNSHSDNVRGSTCATADFHQLATVASLSLSRTVAIDSRQLASHLFCLLPTTYTHTKTRQRVAVKGQIAEWPTSNHYKCLVTCSRGGQDVRKRNRNFTTEYRVANFVRV